MGFSKRRLITILSISLVWVGSLTAQAPGTILPEGEYKRIHQQALREILAGRLDEAVDTLQALLEIFPADAESHFMLTIAYARRGQLDQAAASMERALAAELPPGRFIAGPRDLLQPLARHPAYRQLLARQAGTVIHGPMIGDVTDAGARFWVRLADESRVRVVVEPASGSGKTVRSPPRRAAAPTDYTTVMTVSGLIPDTPYRYRIQTRYLFWWKDGPTGLFRTSPPPGTPGEFTLAFGAGAGYVPPHERMWDTIRSFKPALLLMLGDNIYSDDPESPHMQVYCYYRRQSRPEYRQLLAVTPVYAIWDDHDFGTNDCWGGPDIEEPVWKRAVWNVFRENWVNPAYGGGPARPGCWYDFTFGDVHFIMLECRYYRTDPDPSGRRAGQPDPSMLGPVQKAWLMQRLAASQGTFKVLCSSVPWDFRTKGDSKDTWNGYRDEREEIFGFIEDNGIEGVVLMSADRHRSDAWRIERPDGYDFYEFNSSRLTNQHVHPTMDQALFSYNEKQSFGLVTFDTTADDPAVTYRVVTIDGDTVHTLTVKRSQLQAP